jgi:iron complex outermembrane receptor protein
MNNFVGDGNGYVGNLDLDPETAYTLSTTFDWHAADRNWQVKATPFYTYVEDYIDAVQFGTTSQPEFNVLQYQNQSARLYGIDISGQMALGKNAFGRWNLEAIINYVDGENRDTGDNLYNIMPLNGKFILNQQIAGWRNAIEWEMVDNKDDVNDVRNEIETAGYGLLNLRASHSWDDVQLDFGVENVFDRFYYLPTGGAYVAQGSTMTTNSGMGAPQWGTVVPGMGRSVYAGVRVNF